MMMMMMMLMKVVVVMVVRVIANDTDKNTTFNTFLVGGRSGYKDDPFCGYGSQKSKTR